MGLAALLGAAMGAVGCGSDAGPGVRVTGFVFDGLSGKRLNFFDATVPSAAGVSVANVVDNPASGSQIWTLVDGEIVRAVPCGQGAASELNGIDASGCYQFENLPYNAELPVWVQRKGYEPFYGVLSPVARPDIAFSDAQARVVSRSNEATEHVNLRLFPLGTAESLSHAFTFLYDGRGIDGVSVACDVTPSSTIAGSFLAPAVTGATVLEGRSDANGLVVFSGLELVPGATYSCMARRDATYLGRTLTDAFVFVAGVDAATAVVDLEASAPVAGSPSLYVVSSSVDAPNDARPAPTETDPVSQAVGLSRLVLTFNRPVELVPTTANCQTAALITSDVDADSVVTKLVDDNAAEGKVSEMVGAQLSADSLTLTLEGRFVSFDPDDINTTITYQGVAVRPVGPEDHFDLFTLGFSACGGPSASLLVNARSGGLQSATVRLN